MSDRLEALDPVSTRRSDFEASQRWALRRGCQLAEPASQVELVLWVDAKPNQVKVRHVEDELAGLEEFVPPRHLLCRWRTGRVCVSLNSRSWRWPTRSTFRPLIGSKEKPPRWLSRRRGEGFRSRSTAATRDVSPRALLSESPLEQPNGPRPWRVRPNFVVGESAYLSNQALVELAKAFAAAKPSAVSLV